MDPIARQELKLCVAFVAWQAHPQWPLVVVGNRDEAFERPSDPAHWWADEEGVFGGRDMRHGGTWLGVTREGRWSLVTNFRDVAAFESQGRSRGELVRHFLTSEQPPAKWVEGLALRAHTYNTYNVLVGDAGGVVYHGDRAPGPQALPSGVHGLSNALLNTPWPKVEDGRRRLSQHIAQSGAEDMQALATLLGDRASFPDDVLPDTGMGIEWERRLSPLFITDPEGHYGTRATTVVAIDVTGGLRFLERRWAPDGSLAGETHESFQVDSWASS